MATRPRDIPARPRATRSTSPEEPARRAGDLVRVNRAPVFTLWGAVVARRLGYSEDESWSLGRAAAVLNAWSKGRRLGVIASPDASESERTTTSAPASESVDICGRAVPAVRTNRGVQAVLGGDAVSPASARTYVERAFGPALPAARAAMEALAATLRPEQLRGAGGYAAYEQFRPSIPAGRAGWGARGDLDLRRVRSLAHTEPSPRRKGARRLPGRAPGDSEKSQEPTHTARRSRSPHARGSKR